MYAWEWSHPKLDENELYSKWGTFDKEGELIRKVVTEIKLYSEISIVPLGADPFARLLKDGKVTNPEFVLDRQSLSENLTTNNAMKESVVNFQEVAQFSEFKYNPKTEDMTFAELMAKLGQDPKLTEDQFITEFAKLKGDEIALAALKVVSPTIDPVALQTMVGNAKSEEDISILTFAAENGGKEKLTAAATFFTTALTAQRIEAVKFYKLTQGDKAKEEIVTAINTSNGTTLSAFEDQYKAEYEAAVPLACTACGSEEVSRKTSKTVNPAEVRESFIESLHAKKAKAATERIHGKAPKEDAS
jgi:hypothetical protein